MEDWKAKGARRRGRIPALLQGICELAERRRARICRIPREEILTSFGMERRVNKRKVAEAAARLYPELASHLPPVRKPWMSEDPRSSIFDAAALVLTFSYRSKSSASGIGGSVE